MAFIQGLSGINSSSMGLDVVGNNIANTATVGFKSSNAQFSDIYTSTLNGRVTPQVGLGTTVASVFQQFTQGILRATENPLDIAINGAGFFSVTQGDVVAYTRNGQFHTDSDGYIVNDQNYRLLGYPISDTGQIQTTLAPLQFEVGELAPKTTTEATMRLNLDSGRDISVRPFNAANPSTYNYSVSQTFYDDQGLSHNITYYFVRGAAGDPRPWDVYASKDGGTADVMGSIEFNNQGALTGATPMPMPLPTWPGMPNWSVDFSGSTAFAGQSTVNSQYQNGFAGGQLQGISIGYNGILTATYSNGQSRDIAQIALSTFRNVNGLINAGDNLFLATEASGLPDTGAPEVGGRGQLRALAVEDSNVDLTYELINMISLQRNYQANAQVIKAQDQVMQTLSNMR